MSEKPLVSVIVPIYRVEKYLRRCVESLLSQTLRELEIILVDDGSPDACPDLCDEYAALDERVRVLHKPNGGLLRARISGVAIAKADYVGFVDGDDFVSPEMFETLYRAASEHRAQLTCCSFWMYDSDERMSKYPWSFPSGLLQGDRLERDFYPHWFENRKTGQIGLVKAVWCKLFDRALLTDVYGRVPPQVTIGEDLITTYAVAALAERIVTLPDETPYFYRQSETSMMSKYWRDFYQNEVAALRSLSDMPCREEARPWLREGLERYRAYMLYDILYNEAKPSRASTRAQRAQIVQAFVTQPEWQHAAELDVLPENGDTATSRLLRRLILKQRPRMTLAALWLATQKNKLRQALGRGI